MADTNGEIPPEVAAIKAMFATGDTAAATAAFRALTERAAAGDASAVPAIRYALQDSTTVEAFGGDLGRQAERAMITSMTGTNLLYAEAVRAKLALTRAELAGPAPTPIESLLVERVVLTWVQVLDAEIRSNSREDMSFAYADFLQRRISAAHRRHLTALKALASVRRLAVPALRVTIGRTEVNLVGPAAGRQREAISLPDTTEQSDLT